MHLPRSFSTPSLAQLLRQKARVGENPVNIVFLCQNCSQIFPIFLTNTKKRKEIVTQKKRNGTSNSEYTLARKTGLKSECHLRRQSARILSAHPRSSFREALKSLKSHEKLLSESFCFLNKDPSIFSNISISRQAERMMRRNKSFWIFLHIFHPYHVYCIQRTHDE